MTTETYLTYIRKRLRKEQIPVLRLANDMVEEFGAENRNLYLKLINQVRNESVSASQNKTAAGRAPTQAERDHQNAILKKFSRASYRFVMLNERIVSAQEEAMKDHDLPIRDGLSVTIEVTWRVETPICVGDETDNAVTPLKIGEDWILPGATLRGLIRSTLEIAAFGRLARINGQERYGLRDFTHPRYTNDSPVTRANEVKTGWLLRQEDGQYAILPTEDDGKGWGVVEIVALAAEGWINLEEEDEFMQRAEWASLNRRAKKRNELGKLDILDKAGRGRADARFERIYRFVSPTLGAREQLFQPASDDETRNVVEAALVVSGRQPMESNRAKAARNERLRRVEYVFLPPSNDVKPITLSENAFKRFQYANCRLGRKGMEPTGAWEDVQPTIVERNGLVPVFWVGDLPNNDHDSDFAFGLTRLFKIPHAFSVADVARRSTAAQERHLRPEADDASDETSRVAPDFVEALFGYVFEENELHPGTNKKGAVARRGRVAFGMARARKDAFQLTDPIPTIMMAGRASFAPFYLRGPFKDWSDPQAVLAGRKRFVPRYAAPENAAVEVVDRLRKETEDFRAINSRPAPETIVTKLRLLKPAGEAAFVSRIKLRNVTKEQAGAVLWALSFGGDEAKRHMIGRAKGFGAGQVKAAVSGMRGEWNAKDKKIGPDDEAELLKAFVTFMQTQAPGWMTTPTMRDLMAAADPKVGAKLEAEERLKPLRLKEPPQPRDSVNPFQELRKATGANAADLDRSGEKRILKF